MEASLQKERNVYPLPTFKKIWDKLKFSEADLLDLAEFLGDHPESGDLIQKTGGFRKLRWPAPGNKGKRSGARIIYYFKDCEGNVFLHFLYLKNRRSDLTEAQKKELKDISKTVYK